MGAAWGHTSAGFYPAGAGLDGSVFPVSPNLFGVEDGDRGKEEEEMDAGPEGVGVEEAKPAKVANNPLEPTRAERLFHEATHPI